MPVACLGIPLDRRNQLKRTSLAVLGIVAVAVVSVCAATVAHATSCPTAQGLELQLEHVSTTVDGTPVEVDGDIVFVQVVELPSYQALLGGGFIWLRRPGPDDVGFAVLWRE